MMLSFRMGRSIGHCVLSAAVVGARYQHAALNSVRCTALLSSPTQNCISALPAAGELMLAAAG